MTATTTRTGTTATKPSTRALLLTGLAAAVGAAIATMAVAAAGSAAGISLTVNGATLPIASFGMLTLVFSLVGLVLAVVLSRTVRSPRRVFVRTTVVLTVLSLVPDVLADAAVGTKALLMLTHLVAAAIVIPAVARRLSA